jgi:acyl dehydratase
MKSMPRYWHDLQTGESFTTESCVLSEAAILEFANEFDPQPYHLDSAAAQESIFGDLCASGWQVSATVMRLVNQALHDQDVAAIEIVSVPAMRWKAPVFVNDSLSAEIELTDLGKPSSSDQPMPVEAKVEAYNQHKQVILSLDIKLLITQADGAPEYAA